MNFATLFISKLKAAVFHCNIMLKHVSEQDKGRNMSAASDQGGCRKKSRMRKPKATDSDGLSRAAQLPTEQT